MGRFPRLLLCALALSLVATTQRARPQPSWEPVLLDKTGTRWFFDSGSHQHKPDGVIELWVKKTYDQEKMAEVFRELKMPSSAYDLQLWWFYPDRRIGMVKIVRYSADNSVVETYAFHNYGKPPQAVAFPSGTATEAVWEAVRREHAQSACGRKSAAAPTCPWESSATALREGS